jgi:hypothetical protein
MKFSHVAVAVAVVGGLYLASNNFGQVDCEVLNVSHANKVYPLNNEMDAGIAVEVLVENRGAQGDVSVDATLTSSEGTWTRNWSGTLAKNERTKITADFPEPTILAYDMRASGRCISR